MTLFVNTSNPTPFGIYDSDTAFQTEADNMVTFVKRKLGDDIVSVELSRKQIFANFEEATLVYSQKINETQSKNQLTSYLGTATGSLSGSENKYARESLDFLLRSAEPYAYEVGIGGAFNTISGSILLETGRQDYDLYTEFKDQSGAVIFDGLTIKGKMKVRDVYHFSPSSAYRFFNNTSGMNYLNSEFGFESFTPETIFYVLPVFEDILRAGMMDVSQRVRRSNYSYRVSGTKIRIFPAPTSVATAANLNKLWIRVSVPQNPNEPAYTDESINGVSNISNIPYGNIMYTNMNSTGRQWIRQYTLALSMILLGMVRSKIKSIPIPGGEVTLDGPEMIEYGRAEKEKLLTDLKELLDSMTYDKLMEIQATKAELMQKQLRMIPIPHPILTG